MSNNEALAVFASDQAGVRPGSFADKSSAPVLASLGVVGVIVPSTTAGGRPCGQDNFERRIESAQLLLNGLFGGSTVFNSFAVPGRGAWVNDSGLVQSERVMIVLSFAPGIALASPEWSKMIRAAANLRVLWRQSVIGLVGPNGYTEV